jgi:cation:H+ antiporter
MIIQVIILIFGFLFLIKGADILVEGSSSIAKRFGISDLVIGLTVVAFGTSAPELFVNMVSSLNGQTDIAIGNILGSNIANILLILGVASIITPLAVSKGTVWKEIPMNFLAIVLIGIMANDAIFDKVNYSALTRTDGLTLLAFFVIFLYYTFGIAKNSNGNQVAEKIKAISISRSAIFILLGFIGLSFGGKWVVDSATQIAIFFGVSQAVIGLSIVAIGTSLPELVTSAMAAYRKNTDIAIGNVVGSNIFNIFWILGLSSVINPLPFTLSSNRDILMAIFASFLLFVAMFTGKKRQVERWEGIICVGLYFSYMIYIFIA